MCLKNSSKIINKVLKYLKMPFETEGEIVEEIKNCVNELEKTDGFKYIYKRYDYLLDFLNDKPYIKFLNGCDSYYLVAVTLGLEVERKLKYLSKTNVSKMVIMDAAASAVLEEKANEFETNLGDNLTYRFCPGYEKTNVEDIRIIHKELKAERIGIEILDSCMMNPQKSMIGIVGIKNK